jgi:hypothetical protein
MSLSRQFKALSGDARSGLPLKRKRRKNRANIYESVKELLTEEGYDVTDAEYEETNNWVDVEYGEAFSAFNASVSQEEISECTHNSEQEQSAKEPAHIPPCIPPPSESPRKGLMLTFGGDMGGMFFTEMLWLACFLSKNRIYLFKG